MFYLVHTLSLRYTQTKLVDIIVFVAEIFRLLYFFLGIYLVVYVRF